MAFTLSGVKATIEVVVSKDSCVKCSNDEYQEYLKELDESLLKLEGCPTRFVLRKRLDYKANQILLRSQGYLEGKNFKVDLSVIMEQVRLHLTDIINPPDLPADQHIEFKKDSDGYASKELISSLQNSGVLTELRVALESFDTAKESDLTKKN